MDRFDWKMTIKINIFKLKILGLWPEGETYKPNLYMLYATITIITFVYGHNFFQAINLIFIINDLQAIAGTIFVTLSELLTILKSYYLIQNMGILKQLMITLTSDMFQPRNVRQIKLIEPSLKFWKINYIAYWTMSLGAIFCWSTYPILDKSIKDYRLPFLAWYPYDTKSSPLYEITYVYQIISVLFIASSCLSMDTLICALNMYTGAQLDILCDDLRHICDKIEDDSNDVNEKLISCIKHHKAILKFAADSNNFFNWIVFLQFFTSAVSIGITMFQLTVVAPFSSEFFSCMSFGLAIVVEIFMYCWFGNEVEHKSSNIAYAVFESDWTGTTLEVKKNMLFFVMRCQRPIKVSALNLFYLSLDTFMRILRTSWSYFALLHQVTSRE